MCYKSISKITLRYVTVLISICTCIFYRVTDCMLCSCKSPILLSQEYCDDWIYYCYYHYHYWEVYGKCSLTALFLLNCLSFCSVFICSVYFYTNKQTNPTFVRATISARPPLHFKVIGVSNVQSKVIYTNRVTYIEWQTFILDRQLTFFRSWQPWDYLNDIKTFHNIFCDFDWYIHEKGQTRQYKSAVWKSLFYRTEIVILYMYRNSVKWFCDLFVQVYKQELQISKETADIISIVVVFYNVYFYV